MYMYMYMYMYVCICVYICAYIDPLGGEGKESLAGRRPGRPEGLGDSVRYAKVRSHSRSGHSSLGQNQ